MVYGAFIFHAPIGSSPALSMLRQPRFETRAFGPVPGLHLRCLRSVCRRMCTLVAVCRKVVACRGTGDDRLPGLWRRTLRPHAHPAFLSVEAFQDDCEGPAGRVDHASVVWGDRAPPAVACRLCAPLCLCVHLCDGLSLNAVATAAVRVKPMQQVRGHGLSILQRQSQSPRTARGPTGKQSTTRGRALRRVCTCDCRR